MYCRLRTPTYLLDFTKELTMSQLLELDSSLDEDLIVYRTIDFFSAADIIENRRFMFSRADTFSDKNEGIDRILRQLNLATPNNGCGMGWSDAESAKDQHNQLKQSHYISCWSRNPESVAMWSLYSTDLCSIRVSTKISKLIFPIEELIKKYSVDRLNDADLGKKVIVATKGHIAPVVYTSLMQIANRVGNRAKARFRLAERYAKKGESMPSFPKKNSKYLTSKIYSKYLKLQTTTSLKDSSFEHEQEIRLSVKFGEETWSERLVNKEYIDPSSEHHYLLSTLLSDFSFINHGRLPEREFVSCTEDFIESVAIDPRCPVHKAEFMKNWFNAHGIKIVESTCFGYLPDKFKIYPEW